MRKQIVLALFLVASISGFAQNYQISRVGMVAGADGYYMESQSSIIGVEVLVEVKSVIPGVYSRYAQKYLAMRAPLVEQTTHQIMGATITLQESNTAPKPLVAAPTIVEYATIPADQYTSSVLPAEEAARQAAEAIFTIRRQRREIVNGEAGEGYFGAGLKDAIEALNAMEKEYLELFMGRTETKQTLYNYIVSISDDTSRYMVARFDSKSGLSSANDLSGSPIYLQLNTLPLPDMSSYAPDPKSKVKVSSINLRIVGPTECTLFNDSQPMASATFSLYEFGRDFVAAE